MRTTLRRVSAFLLLALLLATPALAALTPAQYATLKAHIQASPDLNTIPAGPDGDAQIAALMNAAASPTFTVWKSKATIAEVGRAFNGAELAGLTTGNQSRLQTLAQYFASGVTPSNAGIRAFFDDVFSGAGGVNTRAALLALWKRTATRAEKLFATGTGSDAVPATMTFEGPLDYRDVGIARES